MLLEVEGKECRIPWELDGIWDSENDVKGEIHVYVDGSFVKGEGQASAGWGVVVGGDWLENNWMECIKDADALEIMELFKQGRKRKMCGYYGRCVGEVGASFDPELEAVAWALEAVPDKNNICIHIDNKGAMDSIEWYCGELSEGKRSRATHPTIHGYIEKMRKEKTGEVRLVHVKAHENVDDVHKAGNKCADVLAGKGRLMGPDRELELMREHYED